MGNATVKHPTLDGVSQTVDEADVEQWTASGWLIGDGDEESALTDTSSGQAASASSARRRATGTSSTASSSSGQSGSDNTAG